MRRFFIAAASLLTLVFMLPLFTLTAFAENTAQGWDGDSSRSIVYDDAGVFNDRPELLADLNKQVRDVSARTQLNIYVMLAGPTYLMTDADTPTFCNRAYDEYFGNDTDGVFFFIDMTGKKPAYDYFSTAGKAILYYDGETDTIRENTYEYLPSSDEGNYAEHCYDVKRGVECFLNDLQSYQSEFKKGMKYYYDKKTGKYIYYMNGELKITKFKPPKVFMKAGIIGLIGGAIVNLISFLIAKRNYRFKGKTNPNIDLSKEETRFNAKGDTFIRTHTSRTPIPQSSGGSGGGYRSGGGGFSGGSHGGSGGHR